MTRTTLSRFSLSLPLLAIVFLSGCDQDSANQPQSDASSSMKSPDAPMISLDMTAGIQDLMVYMIDPSADFLWESVSESITVDGVVREEPVTDADWHEVKLRAFVLSEGANLLQVDGRHVVGPGKHLEDHGTEGNLTAEQVEAELVEDRKTFQAFARALGDVGKAMMKAADDRDSDGLVRAGEVMDEICESCHLKYWYPGQEIPVFENQAPEVRE